MDTKKTLVKGSLLLLICFGIFNFINFLLQFFMARMLTLSDFGIFAALSSMVYMLSIFIESIQTVITKYSANEDDDGKIKNILNKSLKASWRYSAILFVLYLLASLVASPLLNIEYGLLALNGLIIFGAFSLPVTRGILQGKKRFGSLGGSMVLESVIRFTAAVFLVWIGTRVYGAVLGGVIAMAVAFGASFIPLKKVINTKEKKSETKGIRGYTSSMLLVMAVIVFFYTVDIVIAKIVFGENVAGAYSIASILAKAIFWGTLPVSKVMFPLTSHKKSEKKDSGKVFAQALGIVGLLVIIALAAFYFLAPLIVLIFAGKIVVESVSILFFLGIAMGLISITNVILLYKLSRTSEVLLRDKVLICAAFLLETGLLFYFSANLIQFSIALVTASAAFLFISLYVLNDEENQKK